MKIFTSSEVKDIDTFTIQNEPIQSINLMERASIQLADWIMNTIDNKQEIYCFIGPGNNGGDGLAVARILFDNEYNVNVFIPKISDKLSPDAEINLDRLKKETSVKIKSLNDESELFAIPDDTVIIDALFGSGLARPVEGFMAKVIKHINQSEALKIAIDIPSGLFGEDNSENIKDNIVKADFTLSLQFPNLSFFHYENDIYIGNWEIIPIGLHPEIIEQKETKFYFIDDEMIKNRIIQRNKFAHKGNFGHAFLVSGSYGKMGAAILASKACLRTGVGLLTVHIPQSGYEIIQSTVPEAMVCIDESENCYCRKNELDKYSAIGVGPGIGTKKSVKEALKELITNSKSPLVLDADALNILAENKEWLELLPENSILTPHPKEFERLAGIAPNSYKRNKMQIEFAQKYNVFVVLKGAYTMIACPNGDCFYNSTGNPGMATAGSGDVLTGIILSLLAQGYSSKDAVLTGVFVHGLAGDVAAEETGFEALIASDIINNLGNAFIELNY